MSFWDNVKKFAQPYSDDEYDDYDEEEEYSSEDYNEPAEKEKEQPVRRSSRRASLAAVEKDDADDIFGAPVTSSSAPSSAPSSSGFSGNVVSMNSSSNKSAVVLFRPNSFNDASKAADDLRNRKAVIVNMENVDKAMSRRVVDFLSGCVYALDGDVKKIAQFAYLFCPHNMDIVGNLESIQAELTENYV